MGNFFRSLFGPKKSNSKIKPRMQSRRLELIGLEERITPIAGVAADFTTNTGVLSLTSFSADFSVLANANGTLTVSVNSTSIVSAGSSTTVTVTRIGTTNDYTVSVNSGAVNVKELSLIGDSIDNNFVISSIDSTAFNTDFALNIDTGTELTSGDTLTINGVVGLKGTGALTTVNIESLTIAAAGDIIAVTGAVGISANTISTAGNVDTTSGAITYTGVVTLSGNVVTTSTLAGGNLSITGALTLGVNNFTANQGLGNVTTISGGITGSGVVSLTGAAVTTVGAINTTGILTAVATTGDLTFSAAVSANTVTATSIAGNIIFASTVASTAGSVTVSAATAGKSISIVGAVTAALNSDILLIGDVLSNHATTTSLNTTGNGIITITGNVDASVANNNLTLSAATGAITIGGNVGSSSTAMGDLTADGSGIFLASGTVVANDIKIGQITRFATSVTFAKAVVTTGANKIIVDTSNAGTITFSESITSTNATGVIDLQTVNGNLTVIGAINTKHQVEIDSAAGVVVLSGNITNDGTTIPSAQAGVFISVGSGSLTTSGTITSVGTTVPINFSGRGGIQIQSYLSNSSVTINGALSTTGGGAIRLQAGNGSGINQMSVNAPVTTSGATAGEIIVYANGGSITLNQPVTLGTGGKILLSTGLSTDTITINSGAAISAGTDIYDTDFLARGYLSAGKINLAANLTTTLGKINLEPVGGITLSGPVSMKAQGTTVGDIILGSINGAQNLTLEATDQISLGTVGQTTPLNTFTVTNSTGVTVSGNFNASVVLTDTTGAVAFNGTNTTISNLTTFAKGYSVIFANSSTDTTVLAGTPVFLNTGNVSFSGLTSLTTGATITGGPATVVNLSGTIVSGGAFNIGAGNLNTNIANLTTLNLTSTTNESTIANRVLLSGGHTLFLNGVGTLTLSGDSSDPMHMNGFVGIADVTNGTINITGKLCLPFSGISLTNATITGNGEVGGVFSLAASTVAPSGTLTMGSFIQDATSAYKVSVFNPTSASQILVSNSNSVDINNSTLSLFSIASGLAAGNQFTIIDAAGSSRIIGSFLGLPEGATLSALDSLGNTITFAISYVGGIIGANDVTLTVTNVLIANPSAIPQPMVAGQPLLNYLTAVGADAGGGPMVTVTIDILPGLTTVPTYFSFFAYDEGFTGGVRVTINELDGNSDTLEIITGAGPGGGPNVRVFQFNFPTLTFNPTPVASFFAFNDPSFDGGIYVAGGDVTGDGIGDLLVGAGAGGGPRVQVYAGSLNGVVTSSPISDFFAYSSAFTGGVVVAAGDRTGDITLEVVTGPASNGGYNIKSFNVAGTGNNPTLIENFFAFNDFTSIGGLSIATAIFDANPMDDLVIGTTNTQFGVILNQNYAGIKANPFPGFTGAIRAGFADNLQTGYVAVAAAGPGGGPVISAFSVDPINLTLSQTDSLFVLDPEFTGGLFVAN